MTGTSSGGASVVELAKAQIGKPYVFDTPSDPTTPNPSNFDCSGLTQWTYRQLGVKISHNTVTQYNTDGLAHRDLADAQPGDLVFWDVDGAPEHVAIYAGNGQVIHAPQPGQNVGYMGLNDWKAPKDKVCAFPGSNVVVPNDGTQSIAQGYTVPVIGGLIDLKNAAGTLFGKVGSPQFWARVGLFAMGALILGFAGFYLLEEG